LLGAGALSSADQRRQYDLPAGETDRVDLGATANQERGYWALTAEGEQGRAWLEAAAPRWVEEVSR
jgi:hypothetical protein